MELSVVLPDQEDIAAEDKKEIEERIETLGAGQGHQQRTGEMESKISWCCW